MSKLPQLNPNRVTPKRAAPHNPMIPVQLSAAFYDGDAQGSGVPYAMGSEVTAYPGSNRPIWRNPANRLGVTSGGR